MLLANQSSLQSLAQFLTALLIFVFVLVITWFTTKYIANFQKQSMMGRNVEIIETTKITPNKYLQIIKVGKKYLLIAVCKDTVTMLSELSADDISEGVAGIDQQAEFGDMLKKAKQKLQFASTKKEQANDDEE